MIPVAGKWAKLEDVPMIADDKTYEKMFGEKNGVFFVDTGVKIGLHSDKKNKQGIIKKCLKGFPLSFYQA